MKKPETKKATNGNAQDFGKVDTFSVDKVRVKDNGTVWFTLILNGITVNNCHVVEGKDGHKDFISLPSYKGSDRKYYSIVYFKFSDEDTESILALVEKILNA